MKTNKIRVGVISFSFFIGYLAPPAKIAILAEFSQSENVHSG